ncbi:hypothetical protein [Cellulomonas shaoxiangyii]|uniref:Uncharacterized protein n=1 Tax=Cellulomonas shaoxiangyii TaxID=2566013 RepID=A0A4P7SK07_9CELL|nr:hypothetical protein [Cellulomonas shaoxiangyii]QCB94470.1 hypothetical protein E5225_13815 [Cellulomonas shaoxiangyii]TGY86052.1 hypothetical protein E5226_03540 [Cellulomonas shaoxiangyii]
MNGLAGLVALALVGLWAAYLVPHHLRHRQRLLEARADDRFSAGLRVVAVSRGVGRTVRPALASATAGPSTTALLLTPATGVPAVGAGTATGGTTVDRPHATPERISAEAARRLAQARAARAAASARRGAAARRRGLLATLLLVASVAGWVVTGVVPASTWAFGAVPTVLLGAVTVLGRRAVVAGHAADEAWATTIEREERLASRPRTGATHTVRAGRPATGGVPVVRPGAGPADVPVPLVTGHAVRPSDAHTEVFERIVADAGESAGPARHATGSTPVVRRSATTAPTSGVPAPGDAQADGETQDAGDAEEWSPVPVPRPTYTMKAAAPRRTPAALLESDAEASTTRRPADRPADRDQESAADGAGESAADAARAAEGPVAPLEPVAETTGSIDLNAVLARRRAAGQ